MANQYDKAQRLIWAFLVLVFLVGFGILGGAAWIVWKLAF